MVAAGWLRWPGVVAAYPYLTYVDEGHLLHPVRDLLATGKWNPAVNAYPELPTRGIATAARLLAPLAGRLPFAPPVAQAQARMNYYDVVEPPELVLLARGISWLLSLGTVLLVGALGQRLGGPPAAAVSLWAAALIPALVARGALATVDAYATFFTVAAVVALPLARRRLLASALLAGVCAGMAVISKYTAGVAIPAVIAGLLALPETGWKERLRAALAAAGGAVLAVAVLMPSTWRESGAILARLRDHSQGYDSKVTPSIWHQAVTSQEFDLPQVGAPELGWLFLAAALAGLVLMLARRHSRPLGVAIAALSLMMVGLSVSYTYQMFRNVLPVAALACAAVGLATGWLGDRLGRPYTTAALTATALALLYAGPALALARNRRELVDSRQQSVDWLRENRRTTQPLLITDEMALHPSTLAALGPKAIRAPIEEWRRRLRLEQPRFLLTAELQVDGESSIPLADRDWMFRRYRVVATFGSTAKESSVWAFRDNEMRVLILERRGRRNPRNS